jgi:23S rRNA (uracil1939-C5)-methyltransferase
MIWVNIPLMSSKINSNIILKVDRPAHRGRFIGRCDGKVVMISGATMPGETVEVTVDSDKQDFISATISRIIEPSPERLQPACSYFGTCGGCQLQHMPYRMQVQLKEEILKESLKRIAKMDLELSESVISDSPWNYRLRGQFKVSGEGIGLHKKGTNDVIKTDTCLLMDESINEFIMKTSGLLKKTRIKEIHLTSGDYLIGLVIARKKALLPQDAENLASDLISQGLSGIIIYRGDLAPLSFGNTYTTLDLLNHQYTLSPASFIQSSWKLNQSVASMIKKMLQPLKGKKILDMYAGAGNFSIPLADGAEVTAVEENPYAIEDGKRNLMINDIDRCLFVRSSAEKFNGKDPFDVVLLDPPRPGLSRKAMKNVFKMLPENIVYVSCNPATLARDLKKLSDRYTIDSIRLVDFFPQTFHIESVAFLRLRSVQYSGTELNAR